MCRVEEKKNFLKAKEMIFNVKPGATPRGPKYLNRTATVGFFILKDILLF